MRLWSGGMPVLLMLHILFRWRCCCLYAFPICCCTYVSGQRSEVGRKVRPKVHFIQYLLNWTMPEYVQIFKYVCSELSRHVLRKVNFGGIHRNN
jgi:hypothetical protein